MAKRQPEGGQAPVVARVRIRYAKRGPLRFTSHRDFARAFERALRRARVPIAYSQGFTPHPKISYASAAPTGVASEAEYLEIGLSAPVEPAALAAALDAALSPGLDVLDAVAVSAGEGSGGGSRGASLADRMEASRWRVELPGVEPDALRRAVAAFQDAEEVLVERLTKQGRRRFDARGAVVAMHVTGEPGAEPSAPMPSGAGKTGPSAPMPSGAGKTGPSAPMPSGADKMVTEPPSGVAGVPCAILNCVVRQVTPTVRPDDVLSGLRVVADLEPPVPPRATRLAQGPLTAQGEILDPLDVDRGRMPTESVG
jgi:radical SAM-linked protein